MDASKIELGLGLEARHYRRPPPTIHHQRVHTLTGAAFSTFSTFFSTFSTFLDDFLSVDLEPIFSDVFMREGGGVDGEIGQAEMRRPSPYIIRLGRSTLSVLAEIILHWCGRGHVQPTRGPSQTAMHGINVAEDFPDACTPQEVVGPVKAAELGRLSVACGTMDGCCCSSSVLSDLVDAPSSIWFTILHASVHSRTC